MKLANPLHYPLAVLAGAGVLFVGVRVADLPDYVAIPSAIGVAIAGSTYIQSRSRHPQLKDIKAVGASLSAQSRQLQADAVKLVRAGDRIDLLAQVESICDRALSLSLKIETLSLPQTDESKTAEELARVQAKLTEVRQKAKNSSGKIAAYWKDLADTLESHATSLKEGKTVEEERVVALTSMAYKAKAALQRLDNWLKAPKESDDLAAIELELQSLDTGFDLLAGNIR
jgi:predicted membrane chloride channel (bestrophin family)